MPKRADTTFRALLTCCALAGSCAVTAEEALAESDKPIANADVAVPDDAHSDDLLELETMQVIDAPIDDGFDFDPIRSSTIIGYEELSRRQPKDIFEVLQDVPGVNISGGPITNGKLITIRGFQDTEDVLIKVDGVIKNFEKYRFGGGPFVEPDLLKKVDVQRGPTAAFAGSGAIGGAVVMETKDASDYLKVGERAGATIKLGHDFNNDADQVSLTTYATPGPKADLLFNIVRQRSNDLKLPKGHDEKNVDGERLPNSSSPRDAWLAKSEFYPTEDLSFGFTHNDYDAESLEPFDVSLGVSAAGTYVRRKVRDKTTIFNANYNPASELVDVKGSIGFVDTRLDDIGTVPSGSPALGRTNRFLFDLRTYELDNTSRFSTGPLGHTLRYGAQYHSNRRDTFVIDSAGTRELLVQPPGRKEYVAFIIGDTIEWGDFTFSPSVRRDYYKVSAKKTAARSLMGESRSTEIEFHETSPSFSLSYRVLGGPVRASYSYSKSFRPPLIDEYYAPQSNTCLPIVLSLNTPWFTLPVPPGAPGYASGLCADVYEPETIVNQELSLYYETFGLFHTSDELSAKLTYYEIDVDNVLETISLVSASEIGQPGEERRSGWEAELGYRASFGFARLSYSTTRGTRECASWAAGDGEDLVLPADVLNLTIGLSHFGGALEYGYRGRKVWSRKIIEDGFIVGGIDPCKSPYPVETQDGYLVHNAFVTWQPQAGTVFRLAVDNIADTDYETENEIASGIPAPGRSVRISVSHSF